MRLARCLCGRLLVFRAAYKKEVPESNPHFFLKIPLLFKQALEKSLLWGRRL